MIFAFEGIDGSGKNTQAKLLANFLANPTNDRYIPSKVAIFSFPRYDTPIGATIKKLLTTEAVDKQLTAFSLQGLMALDQANARIDIERAKQDGHVILDRHAISGIVYGHDDDVPVSEYLPVSPHVDIWILLDVPPEASFERRPERRDRYERDAAKLSRIREGYLTYFRKLSKGIIVDGVGTVAEVARRVRDGALALMMATC